MLTLMKGQWNRAREAATQYARGVSIPKSDIDSAKKMITEYMLNKPEYVEKTKSGKITKSDSMKTLLEAVDSLPKKEKYAYSAVELGNLGKFNEKTNAYDLYGTDIYRYRGMMGKNAPGDLAAVGAVAAAGVIGYSAVAGAANLVRGDD